MGQQYGQAQTEFMVRGFASATEAFLQTMTPQPAAERPKTQVRLEGTTTEIENFISHLGVVAVSRDPALADAMLSDAGHLFDFIDGLGWPSKAQIMPAVSVPKREESWWPANSGTIDLIADSPTRRIPIGDYPTLRMSPVHMQHSFVPLVQRGALTADYTFDQGLLQ
jgi:hypothetical protein